METPQPYPMGLERATQQFPLLKPSLDKIRVTGAKVADVLQHMANTVNPRLINDIQETARLSIIPVFADTGDTFSLENHPHITASEAETCSLWIADMNIFAHSSFSFPSAFLSETPVVPTKRDLIFIPGSRWTEEEVEFMKRTYFPQIYKKKIKTRILQPGNYFVYLRKLEETIRLDIYESLTDKLTSIPAS